MWPGAGLATIGAIRRLSAAMAGPGATMKIKACRSVGKYLASAGAACVLAGSAGALTAASAAHGAATARPPCPAPAVSGGTATVTYCWTGGSQYWTVPAGVTQATFTLYGAEGDTLRSGPGGTGAEVTGTLPVTPGSALQVNAGQGGADTGAAFGGGAAGNNDGSGGGGGASDIRSGTYTLAGRLLVAGGGGGGGADGAGAQQAAGGAGGNADSPGAAGASGRGCAGGGGGGAGTATTGGAGGTTNTSAGSCGSATVSGAAGSEGNGGKGSGSGGGGGGGGYYGGGGGAGSTWDSQGPASGGGGGGGGSSYTGTATDASVNDDPASTPSRNGEVIITYRPVLAVANHSLSGHETAVSCLTASRCAAVGSRGGRGVVVTLANGAQSHAAVLHGAAVIDSVSCPSRSGCWAIGRPHHGGGAYLVKISSAGRPAAERTVPVPAGMTLGPISCASMTSCEVAGVIPGYVEIGTWNGTRLHLYRVSVPRAQVSMEGLSCWHSDCAAVGSSQLGRANSNWILTTTGGKPGTLNADSGYALTSISCVSATTCYAAGAAVLVTVTGGVAADPQPVAGDWDGTAIACTGAGCEAAGGEEFGAAYADVLVSLTGGTAGSPVIVRVGQGYSGIAARGTGFIAIGAGSNSRSEDTVG